MEKAILTTGGKQYQVCPGDTIEVELLSTRTGDIRVLAQAGDSRVFEHVLMLETDDGVQVGSPYLPQISVRATVLENFRADKVRVFKMRRRKKSRRTQGHRQYLSRVRIDTIEKSA